MPRYRPSKAGALRVRVGKFCTDDQILRRAILFFGGLSNMPSYRRMSTGHRYSVHSWGLDSGIYQRSVRKSENRVKKPSHEEAAGTRHHTQTSRSHRVSPCCHLTAADINCGSSAGLSSVKNTLLSVPYACPSSRTGTMYPPPSHLLVEPKLHAVRPPLLLQPQSESKS